MVIDMHVHAFSDAVAERAVRTLAEKSELVPYTDGSIGATKKYLKKAGIDLGVLQPVATRVTQVTSINDWALASRGEGIHCFGAMHPDFDDAEDEIRRLDQHGVRGIKMHSEYQQVGVMDARLQPVYDALEARDMAVLFHVGCDLGFSPPYFTDAAAVAELAAARPRLLIIAAHMGEILHYDRVLRCLAGKKNVYFDTSFALRYMGDALFAQLVDAHGEDRILFGSDLPWGDPAADRRRIESMALCERTKEKIFEENARKLLGI